MTNISEIASINSYKGGKLNVTIRSKVTRMSLTGKMCEFEIETSDRGTLRVLCRINSVDMANPIHENRGFQQAIADQGKLQYYSGECDVVTATVEIISCITADSLIPTSIACPPQSGTPLTAIEGNSIIDFQPEKQYQGTIGNLIDAPEMPMSITVRHFGAYDKGGYGEAKHSVVFGQNGSGKTVIALAKIACELVQNPQMGCLIPDTAGDIAKHGSHDRGDFKFSFLELLDKGGRLAEQINIEDIRLVSKTFFKQMLAPIIRQKLNTVEDNARRLTDKITESLFDKTVDITKATPDVILNMIVENVATVFSTKAKQKEKTEQAQELTQQPLKREFIKTYNANVVHFFEGKYALPELVDGFLDRGRVILLNMSKLSEQAQRSVMYEIFAYVKSKSEKDYKAFSKTRNGLIVLDEGPRWCPQSGGDEITSTIIDAYNTTRKLGIGWMIISQRITAIDKNILAQAHTKFVGRGMGIGADAEYISTLFGKEGLVMYDSLRLRGGYFWLATGHQVNYGQGSQYMAFDSFGGNATAKIIKANPHIWKNQEEMSLVVGKDDNINLDYDIQI